MMFGNGVLRRMFGPKRNEMTRQCKNVHNEDFHDVYSLPSIIRIIKSRIIG
jgi:hypothetical protein